MATREEKQAAQDQLQKAVENILSVYDTFDEGEVIAGWALIISLTRGMIERCRDMMMG